MLCTTIYVYCILSIFKPIHVLIWMICFFHFKLWFLLHSFWCWYSIKYDQSNWELCPFFHKKKSSYFFFSLVYILNFPFAKCFSYTLTNNFTKIRKNANTFPWMRIWALVFSAPSMAIFHWLGIDSFEFKLSIQFWTQLNSGNGAILFGVSPHSGTDFINK